MDIKYVKAQSFKHSLYLMKNAIDSRKIDLDRKHFCFVPDDLTLLTERIIFEENGAFDVEVLTFNRLFSKVVSKTANYLPRYGAIMLLKSVIDNCKDDLKFFKNSVGFDGFVKKMYDTIASLQGSLISPCDLFALTQNDKICDIALIYSRYLEACGDFHIDALGRSRLLSEELKESDLKDTAFYFAAYSGFTKQQKRIIDAIAVSAASVTIFQPQMDGHSFESVELYEALDAADQLKAAAVRMRELKKNGVPFGKMCVVAPSLGFEQARRILKEFEIPFNLSEKAQLNDSVAARFLKSLFDAVFSRYEHDDVMTLSKNFLAKIDKDYADVFENYCNRFCIDRKRFCEPFSIQDKNNPKALIVAERVRKRIFSLVERFSKLCGKVTNAASFCDFLTAFFDEENLKERLEELVLLSGQGWQENSFDKILENAETLKTILGDKPFKARELFELLFEGLASVEISTIPSVLNAVEISSASNFRAGGYDYMFVIGFCEGEIPPVRLDDNIMLETDIDTLNSFDLELEPRISKVNDEAANDFLSAAATMKSVFLAFSNSHDKRVSVLKDEISRNCKRLKQVSFVEEKRFLELFNPLLGAEHFDDVARLCSSKGNTLELMLKSFSSLNNGEKPLEFYSELNKALDSIDCKKYTYAQSYTPLFLANSDKAFFKNSIVSVSQIQNYFNCPYMHFLSYGLGLKEKPDGKLSALDIGKIMHKAVEDFVRESRFDTPREDMTIIVDKIIDGIDKSVLEANKAVIERIAFEATQLAEVLASQLLSGSFEWKYLEEDFGKDETDVLKTISLPLKRREIFLKGKIDRVDVFGDFARVIDYKSGSQKGSTLSFADLYFGRKIQLFVYLKILRENNKRSAGVFYFPLSVSWNDDEYSRRLSGVFNDDPEILRAYDRMLENPKYKSKVINVKSLKDSKKELVKIGTNNNAFSETQLDRLSDYAKEVFLVAAKEIEEGYIAQSPLDNTCSFCDFARVCKGSSCNITARSTHSVTGEEIVSVMDLQDGEERYGS